MGLLANCPKCGCMYAKGTVCPSCKYTENQEVIAQETTHQEEFARRYAEHQRNYGIFMGLSIGVALLTIVIAILGYKSAMLFNIATHSLDVAADLEDSYTPQPTFTGRTGYGPQSDDEDDPPEIVPMQPASTSAPRASRVASSSLNMSLLFIGLLVLVLVAWAAMTFMLTRCRLWWPIALHCPACNLRLDEIGFEKHCPGCQAHLR